MFVSEVLKLSSILCSDIRQRRVQITVAGASMSFHDVPSYAGNDCLRNATWHATSVRWANRAQQSSLEHLCLVSGGDWCAFI